MSHNHNTFVICGFLKSSPSWRAAWLTSNPPKCAPSGSAAPPLKRNGQPGCRLQASRSFLPTPWAAPAGRLLICQDWAASSSATHREQAPLILSTAISNWAAWQPCCCVENRPPGAPYAPPMSPWNEGHRQRYPRHARAGLTEYPAGCSRRASRHAWLKPPITCCTTHLKSNGASRQPPASSIDSLSPPLQPIILIFTKKF